jgi:acyl-CoA synthetase (AMP-forming)/AMP-acid ligase II
MIWLPKFDAQEVVRLLPHSTVFMGVPTLYVRLLAEPGLDRVACRNMRLFISGSAPMLVETFEAWRERTGHTILERYGMSETGIIASNPCDGERRPGSVGLPLPGVSLRVVDADSGAPLGAELLPPVETPSAGFILLSIGQGIIYTMHNTEMSKESESLFAAGIMVFFPGMLLLCYYSGFPVWLRIFGLMATLPFLVIMIKIDGQHYDLQKDQWLSITGFVMLQLTGILWGYFVLRPYRQTTVQQ